MQRIEKIEKCSNSRGISSCLGSVGTFEWKILRTYDESNYKHIFIDKEITKLQMYIYICTRMSGTPKAGHEKKRKTLIQMNV